MRLSQSIARLCFPGVCPLDRNECNQKGDGKGNWGRVLQTDNCSLAIQTTKATTPSWCEWAFNPLLHRNLCWPQIHSWLCVLWIPVRSIAWFNSKHLPVSQLVLHNLGSSTSPKSEPGPYSQVKLLAVGLIGLQDILKWKRMEASQFAHEFFLWREYWLKGDLYFEDQRHFCDAIYILLHAFWSLGLSAVTACVSSFPSKPSASNLNVLLFQRKTWVLMEYSFQFSLLLVTFFTSIWKWPSLQWFDLYSLGFSHLSK